MINEYVPIAFAGLPTHANVLITINKKKAINGIIYNLIIFFEIHRQTMAKQAMILHSRQILPKPGAITNILCGGISPAIKINRTNCFTVGTLIVNIFNVKFNLILAS